MTERLTKEDRREQLLDVAAQMLLERGFGGLTMEGLAARSGVSKAVPYLHFSNADAVVVELFRREMANMSVRILESLTSTDDPEERLRVAIGAYFDVVIERGAILAMLFGPGSPVTDLAEDRRTGELFVATLFSDGFGVTPKQAAVAASVFMGALNAGVEALARGVAGRARIERTLFDLACHLARTGAAVRG